MGPAECIAKALYVLNYLWLAGDHDEPPMIVHSSVLKSGLERKEKILVQYKDLETGQWKGPVEVQMTGRGYMCLLTGEGLRWVPARWVRPWKETASPAENQDTPAVSG